MPYVLLLEIWRKITENLWWILQNTSKWCIEYPTMLIAVWCCITPVCYWLILHLELCEIYVLLSFDRLSHHIVCYVVFLNPMLSCHMMGCLILYAALLCYIFCCLIVGCDIFSKTVLSINRVTCLISCRGVLLYAGLFSCCMIKFCVVLLYFALSDHMLSLSFYGLCCVFVDLLYCIPSFLVICRVVWWYSVFVLFIEYVVFL